MRDKGQREMETERETERGRKRDRDRRREGVIDRGQGEMEMGNINNVKIIEYKLKIM